MERIESINPERISWCCADYGITPNELASELGIAATSIERLLAGEGGITFNQLRKIAEHFGRGVLFFWSPGRSMLHRFTHRNSAPLPTRNLN